MIKLFSCFKKNRQHPTLFTPKLDKQIPNFSLLHLLVVILMIWGCVRILTITLHTPMYGYSNNWDFIRVQSFHGCYPTNGIRGAYLDAPVSEYKLTGPIDHNYFYLTSEMLFTSLAINMSVLFNLLVGNPLTDFSLYSLGMLKSGFLIIIGIFLTLLFFRKNAGAGILSAAIFAILIADPMNTLYFNTLYYDSSVFIFNYLSMGLLLYILFFRERNRLLLGIVSLSLLMLGMSKVQYFLLPICMTAGFGILYWL